MIGQAAVRPSFEEGRNRRLFGGSRPSAKSRADGRQPARGVLLPASEAGRRRGWDRIARFVHRRSQRKPRAFVRGRGLRRGAVIRHHPHIPARARLWQVGRRRNNLQWKSRPRRVRIPPCQKNSVAKEKPRKSPRNRRKRSAPRSAPRGKPASIRTDPHSSRSFVSTGASESPRFPGMAAGRVPATVAPRRGCAISRRPASARAAAPGGASSRRCRGRSSAAARRRRAAAPPPSSRRP